MSVLPRHPPVARPPGTTPPRGEVDHRLLAEAIPQQVWVALGDSTPEYVNERWLTYFEHEPDDSFSGGASRRVIHPEDASLLRRLWRTALAAGEPFEHEVRLRRARDGLYRWHVMRATPVLDEAAGRVIEAVCGTLGRQLGALWEVDTGAGVIRRTGVWSLGGAGAADFVGETTGGELAPGVGLPGRVWVTGDAAWIEDLSTDTNFPRAAGASRAGFASAVAVPVVHDRERSGASSSSSRPSVSIRTPSSSSCCRRLAPSSATSPRASPCRKRFGRARLGTEPFSPPRST